MDVVDILDNFLKTSGLNAGTREGANVYKLDEATEEVDLAMSALTNPEAPHYFRICRRKHLGTLTACGDGATEAATCHRAEHRGYQPNGNDVVKGSHGASVGVTHHFDGACCRPRSLAWIAIAVTGYPPEAASFRA